MASCNSCDFWDPTFKCVRKVLIRWFLWGCPCVSWRLTILHFNTLQLFSIIILKYYSILIHGAGVGCCVIFCTCNLCYLTIPTRKGVSILSRSILGWSLSSICRSCSILKLFTLQFCTIFVQEPDNVCICCVSVLCCIGLSRYYCCDFRTPTIKHIGIFSI